MSLTSTILTRTSFITHTSTSSLTLFTTSNIHLHTIDNHNTNTITSSTTSNPPENTLQTPLPPHSSPSLPLLSSLNNGNWKTNIQNIEFPTSPFQKDIPSLETLNTITSTLKKNDLSVLVIVFLLPLHQLQNVYHHSKIFSNCHNHHKTLAQQLPKHPISICTKTEPPKTPSSHKPQYISIEWGQYCIQTFFWAYHFLEVKEWIV